MSLGQIFTTKNYKKFNFEDKNIEKYALLRKTIFMFWENIFLYNIYICATNSTTHLSWWL
jgi:hypothetical protein